MTKFELRRSISINKDDAAFVDELCQESGMSFSTFARMAIKRELKRVTDKNYQKSKRQGVSNNA
jgi:hypothetical protein